MDARETFAPSCEKSSALPSSGDMELRRSEEHTSELQSQPNLVCRLLLEQKNHRGEDDERGTTPILHSTETSRPEELHEADQDSDTRGPFACSSLCSRAPTHVIPVPSHTT